MTRQVPVGPARWPRTLHGRLTVGLVTVLLVACATLGVATALFLRSFLTQRLDDELAAAGGRLSISLENGRGVGHDGDDAVPGQSPGTLGVRLVAGRVTDAVVVRENGTDQPVTFAPAALDRVRTGAGPVSVDLRALGDYRVQAVAGRDGDVQLTGLPLRPVGVVLTRLAVIESVVFAVVVSAGAVGTTVLVRRVLRPLETVAATAAEVVRLPLAGPGRSSRPSARWTDRPPRWTRSVPRSTGCSGTSEPRWPRGTPPRPGCGGSSPTPDTNCGPHSRW